MYVVVELDMVVYAAMNIVVLQLGGIGMRQVTLILGIFVRCTDDDVKGIQMLIS